MIIKDYHLSPQIGNPTLSISSLSGGCQMKVFISWSKQIGLHFAVKIKQLLESIDPAISAFVSEVDIIGGEDVQQKIIASIDRCDKLVICFTKETKKAPWLLFEAGYARGRKKKVIPLLFDNDPNWHSWIDNPMNIAREIRFDAETFATDLMHSFEIENTAKNRRQIEHFRDEIFTIKKQCKTVDVECEDLIERLVSDDAFFIENPYFRDKTAFFLTGFESFELYKALIDSFLYTGKYFWIYGRKNMKLFSGNYERLFRYLDEKSLADPVGMEGIDFRCLFLDPDSDEVKFAHKQPEILASELRTCIMRAQAVVDGIPRIKKCFRCYSIKREEIITRLDNCIIYSRPVFDAYGRPQLLTNSSFEVFSARSNRGKDLAKKYEQIWDNAREMF